MDPWQWAAVAVLVAIIVILLSWRMLHRFGFAIVVERAKEMFRLEHERLETEFFHAAGQSGKPRGLLWKACDFADEVRFVRERATNQIAALVAVSISFEAIPGGDMEGLPAVGNLRHGSAVFFFQAGQWSTAGRAVFNMNPAETIRHFDKMYEPI